MKTTFNVSWPLMEDDLKKYLSSNWSDISQILNISSCDQTKVKKGFNEDSLQCKMTSDGRWTQNIKIWNPSRDSSDLPQILNISSCDQTKVKKGFNEDNFHWKTTFHGRRPSMKNDLLWKMTFNRSWPAMEGNLQWKMNFNGRRTSMENHLQLKIWFWKYRKP